MRKVRGFTLIELMIVVAITGILASVAIPSMVKYVRRSQTVEAVLNIRKMYDGAVSYYVAEHTDTTGVILNKMFPAAAPLTPAAPPKGVKMAPNLALWKTDAWQALDFAITDPFRFSYQFDNQNPTGAGTSAFAIMRAQGDLNGNGVLSDFERSCTGTLEGVQGGSGLVTVNEIE